MDWKAKEQYFVDFVGTAGAVKVQATLANSSTLMLQTPGKYRRLISPLFHVDAVVPEKSADIYIS